MNTNGFVVDLKVIVVGNPFTGKTSFVKKWTNGNFNTSYKATIVSEFGCKTINIGGTMYRIQLWDLAGQDRTPYLTKIFSRDCQGALILCEANDDDSLNDVKQWIEVINQHVKFIDGSNLPYLFIQNKYDLVSDTEGNKVKMDNYCNDNSIQKYFSASAKTGYNINESMEYLLGVIIEKWNNCSCNTKDTNSINLRNGKMEGEGQKKKCCF